MCCCHAVTFVTPSHPSLDNQLEDKRRKSDALEDAFQRIRSATGLDRVDDIVHKFLNRDKTNAELQVSTRDFADDINARDADSRNAVRVFWVTETNAGR